MAIVATVLAGVATAAELAGNIQKMTSIIPKAAKELTQKHRWMTVTVFNQTQYTLVYERAWFKKGTFWTAPTNIAPFESMTFSICSKNTLSGVKGGVVVELQMPKEGGGYKKQDIAIGFARPNVGASKSSALFSSDPEKAFDQVNKESTRRTSGNYMGTNSVGGQAAMNFLAVASPGRQASVTITQQILKETT